jgi:3-oxoacyl-(acyl-carrier-protein) synthase
VNQISIHSASHVTEADLPGARLGARFGRLDLPSQLALLAVAWLKVDFAAWPADRVAICLAANGGSLSTDVNFWKGRDGVGGPSPTLFAYTLPSAAVGEIAIHFRLTGPNLCFVGNDQILLPEGADLIRRGAADACLCVFCEVSNAGCAEFTALPPAASACALLLQRGGTGRECPEFDRDMKRLCTLISHAKSAG